MSFLIGSSFLNKNINIKPDFLHRTSKICHTQLQGQIPKKFLLPFKIFTRITLFFFIAKKIIYHKLAMSFSTPNERKL